MQATLLTGRLRPPLKPREWLVWKLPPLLRSYVIVVPCAAFLVICLAAARTDWHILDTAKFLLLMCCGMISVASTPRIMYRTGGVTRDFTTIWVLPTAILLPPVYAALAPIPLYAILQLFVHRGVIHRTVFSAAAVSLGYCLASVVFRMFPSSFAGPDIGSGLHAFAWVAAVAVCEIIGGRVHNFMILGAVKLSDPQVRIRSIELNREALQGLFAEIDLGALITLAIALSPALVVLAVPTVLLVRRFLVYPTLVAQSRVDAKTGLLNVSTWEREAESEISRSRRTQSPVALALVDIDHFKGVNDTYGHLVGDRVLKAVADALKGQLRDYDKAGRFGGEEFVLLFAQASEDEACRIAERLRAYVAEMKVPVSDAHGADCARLTISIGVTAMAAGHTRNLTDMMSAADSALYQAKQTGRNKVCVARQVQKVELEITMPDLPAVVEADPAGTSLCLLRSL